MYGTDQNYHINDAGVIECIVGSKVDDIENKVISMNFSAKYSQEDVLKAVEKHLGFAPDYEVTPKPEIILYPISGKYHYVYEVEVGASSPCYISCTYYIDASDLSIMTVNNQIRGIDGNEKPEQGSGIGQCVKDEDYKDLLMVFNTVDNKYYLKNTVDNFHTRLGTYGWREYNPEKNNSFNPPPEFGELFSYDKNKFDNKLQDDDLNLKHQKAAVDAHSSVSVILRRL